MYVHGCANPIKYLYLQGHFSKRDFREMSFFVMVKKIRMEESIMTNTALRAGLLSASGTCSVMTRAKRRPQSTDNTHMVFANEEHEKFYDEKLEQAGYGNYHSK